MQLNGNITMYVMAMMICQKILVCTYTRDYMYLYVSVYLYIFLVVCVCVDIYLRVV